MSISETRDEARTPEAPGMASTAVVAREAALAAALVTGLVIVFEPRALGLGLNPHPAWVMVLILSARYGSRGFAFAFSFLCAALTLAASSLGLGLGPLARAADSPANVAALAMSVLVAWIASAHERRIAELTTRGAELARRSAEDGTIIRELRDAAFALRARADRLDHSLTFLRDVAVRFESGDVPAAAQAALELAIARTGARAGVVQVKDRGRLRTVASEGMWTLERATPPDVLLDRTVQAACQKRGPVCATEIERPRRCDSDVAVPIVDDRGAELGVLALRGLPPDSLSHALLHDLELIARWCGDAGGAQRSRRPDAAEARERNRISQPRLESVGGSRSRTYH